MKKYVYILIVTLLGFQSVKSQDNDQVVYGHVRTDGYQKVTKGAYWKTRPEAKMVYEGSYPPGVDSIYILDKDYFCRFVDGEHNQNDKNYIVVPKGEKVYTKDGHYYMAICGNEIEYLKPVDRVRIVEKENTVVVHDVVHDTIVQQQQPQVVQSQQVVQPQSVPIAYVVQQQPQQECSCYYQQPQPQQYYQRPRVNLNLNLNYQRRVLPPSQPYYQPYYGPRRFYPVPQNHGHMGGGRGITNQSYGHMGGGGNYGNGNQGGGRAN